MNLGTVFSSNFLNRLKAVFGFTLSQTKFLSANATSAGNMTDLTFNNLEVGKKYRVSGVFVFNAATTNIFHRVAVTIFNGSDRVSVHGMAGRYEVTTGANTDGVNTVFTATATQLTFLVGGIVSTGRVIGTGTREGTFITLEELPNHVETTKWS